MRSLSIILFLNFNYHGQEMSSKIIVDGDTIGRYLTFDDLNVFEKEKSLRCIKFGRYSGYPILLQKKLKNGNYIYTRNSNNGMVHSVFFLERNRVIELYKSQYLSQINKKRRNVIITESVLAASVLTSSIYLIKRADYIQGLIVLVFSPLIIIPEIISKIGYNIKVKKYINGN